MRRSYIEPSTMTSAPRRAAGAATRSPARGQIRLNQRHAYVYSDSNTQGVAVLQVLVGPLAYSAGPTGLIAFRRVPPVAAVTARIIGSQPGPASQEEVTDLSEQAHR